MSTRITWLYERSRRKHLQWLTKYTEIHVVSMRMKRSAEAESSRIDPAKLDKLLRDNALVLELGTARAQRSSFAIVSARNNQLRILTFYAKNTVSVNRE